MEGVRKLMRLNRITGSIALLASGLGILGGPLGLLRDAGAASPTAAARKCRAAIAAGGRAVVAAGLGSIDGCHARRDKGKFTGDCNVIPNNAVGFTRAKARAEATINARCPVGNPVLANYPNGVDMDVFSALKALLEQSGAEVQGTPAIASDPSRKPKSKCHQALGKGRSGIINDIVKRSTTCQKKLDKRATTFGPLDPGCIVGPGGSVSKGRTSITKACSGIVGADVGSCSSLPDCVLTEGTTSGQAMAKAIYTATTPLGQHCGNGVVEGTEQCDDGKPDQAGDDTDACRNNCTRGVCGDGVVASVLGEECDDANAVPGDGCTDCKIDGATCGTNGLDAVVSLVFNPENFHLAALYVNLGYERAGVSIPGSGDAQSVLERVTDLTGRNVATFNDDSKSTNADPLPVPALNNLLNTYASNELIAPGPFEQVRFDCTVGAFIRPSDFDCSPKKPAAIDGNCFVTDAAGKCADLSRDLLDCRVTQVATAGAIPTTASTSSSTSSTVPTTTTATTTVPTTTTTTNPHVCGNGIVEGPAETCDDGNTVDESTVDPPPPLPPDACPANCRIESCTTTAQMVSVDVNFSSTASIAGYKVFVDYPESKVIIPGVGQPAAGVITNDPTNGAVGNDLDYGIIVVGSQINAIPPPRLFTLNFTRCTGPPPVAADFHCTVHQATDRNGSDAPMTCSVSIP